MRNLEIKAICTALVSMFLSPAFARQLSVEEAVWNAPAGFSVSNTRSSHDALYTEKIGNLNVAYILSSPGNEGYVVLAADDLLPAVLGYADKGKFDSASMPPAMKYWLSEYGRQLEYAASCGLNAPAVSKVANRPSIPPLCEATWSQSRPFNNNCPSINGSKAPTGCTATAMAQVMYAHKWPITGTGNNTYISGTTREKMYFDFESTTFDWDNMLPSYSSGYSEGEGAAVATLMEACGNAALMSYGASASGAYPYDAVYGMVKFMGYDRSALMIERDYYTSDSWNDLVYSELDEGRPVIYGGYDSSYQNGHTFIVDGYGGDGFYHLNWGWGGMSNGYFLLTALDPAEQGIGGSGSGYNYRQDAIINIMPQKEGSDYQLEVTWYGPFATVNKAYTSVGNVDFIVGNDGYFEGFTLVDTNAVMGVKLIPKEGGDTVFYPAAEFDFPSHYGIYESKTYNKFTIPVSDFPKEGDFIVTPAYEHNGSIKDVAIKVGETKSFVMTCSARGVKFDFPDADRTLTADNIVPVGKLYSGKPCTVKADIHNSGEEYLGMVKAGFENAEGQVRTWLDGVPVNLTDGETVSVTFSGVLNSYNTTLPPGRYKLNIFDEAGESICPHPLDVEVIEAPSGKPVFDISLDILDCSNGDGSNISPYLIGDEIDLEVKVDVSSGLFEDVVALYAYYSDNSDLEFSGNSVSYKNFFVAPGESQTATFHLGTSYFEMDRTAYIRAYGWNSDWSAGSLGWIGRSVYVKRTSTGVSSIEDGKSTLSPNPAVDFTTVTAVSSIKNIEVYSLTGLRMLEVLGNGSESLDIDISALQAGHYIVIVNTVSGVEHHRLIKKQ
ncbi:MAG: thiol protease/hemagglutinin PrtT [Muribaculaceae bacterium]|nr:thiol protease/hemagglutinin PrtT [Muribaculaceae bacterium]